MLPLLVFPEFAFPLVRRPMTSVRSAALQTSLTTSELVLASCLSPKSFRQPAATVSLTGSNPTTRCGLQTDSSSLTAQRLENRSWPQNPQPTTKGTRSRLGGSVTTRRCRRHRDFLEGRFGPMYDSATTRTGGSASSGRSAQKPCRKSAGGATIAVQAND